MTAHPAVIGGFLAGGACSGAMIGYTMIQDPVAAALGAFSGASVSMLLHALLKCGEKMACPKRDALDDVAD